MNIEKIVEFISKKLELNLKDIINHGFGLSLNQIVTFLKGFLLSVLFANYLLKETYGEYSFFMTIIGIVGIFSLPGMNSAIIQSVARNEDGNYIKAIKEIFKWSWLGSLGIVLFGLIFKLLHKEINFPIILLLAISIPFLFSSQSYNKFFMGQKKFKRVTIINIYLNIFTLVFISIGIFLKLNLFWLVTLTILPQILIQGYYTIKILKKEIRNKNENEETLKFGKKFSLSLIINLISENIDKIFISIFLGFEEMAIYSVAIIIPVLIKNLMSIFDPMYLPKISERKEIKNKNLIKYALYITIIIVTVISITYLSLNLIYSLFFSQYKTNALFLSQILLLGYLSYSGILFNTILQSKQEFKKLTQISVFNLVIFTILILTLNPYLGLIGIAIARAATRFLTQLSFIIATLFFTKKQI